MKTHFAVLLASAAFLTTAGFSSATEMLGVGTPNATQFRAKASASDAFEVLSRDRKSVV